MRLHNMILAGCLFASLAFAQEGKDKKKPAPTPTPAPVMTPPPTPPAPTPLPKVDSPPQSSGKGTITMSWGEAAKDDAAEEKPPAPGIIRVSWEEPQESQTEAQGLFGGLGSSGKTRFIYKLPILRRRAPPKEPTVQAEATAKPPKAKGFLYKLPILRKRAPKAP